ncbi:MAG: protein translocase subunit SecF [Longimicrobiales bacterium]
MRRILHDTHFDFMGSRHKAFRSTVVALLIGLAIAIMWEFTRGSWLNYGVDFAGGTLIQVQIAGQATDADLRAVIEPQIPNAEVNKFGDGNEFLIRTPQSTETAQNAGDIVPQLLRDRFGASSVEVVNIEFVGAKVGGELQARAIMAILLSFLATLIYLAFRMEWRFGLAAIMATAYDVVFTVLFISALQLEVALPMVAAVLTIVGYSMNDKVVVFDRVRENLRATGRREDFETLLNRSINETLPRTTLTGTTTLATLFSLFIFTEGLLRDFSLVLIFGIILGTFSSIFVASPALLEIERRWPAERKKVRIAKVRTA